MSSEQDLFQNDFEDSNMSNTEIINKRKIINGYDDGLMQISPLKHPWAYEIFKSMQKNNWVAEEITFQRDYEQWSNNELNEQEKQCFLKALAFASNLDGLLTRTLSEMIKPQITSPEVSLAISRQIYEEALHVDSYSTMIESLSFDPEEVYGMYRKDKQLFYKNKEVLKSVNKIKDPGFKTGTFENDQLYLEALTTNLILEGVFFFSAFLIFFNFGRQNKMNGSREMIQFINRDEDLHVALFVNIINTIKEEQPELWTDDLKKLISTNMKASVEMEAEWGASCVGEGILGLTPQNVTEYIQFIGDIRLESIGLPKIWNSKNPFPWLDEFTQGNMIEVNFFEGKVKEYQTGTLEW